jgi:hypothetical protein
MTDSFNAAPRVFATRIATDKPVFNQAQWRWEWRRYAANTAPRLPAEETGGDRTEIPWPTPDPVQIPERAFSSFVCVGDTMAQCMNSIRV